MMAPRKTFGSILDEHHGAGPGYDLFRLALALIILAAHCSGISGSAGLLSALLKEIAGFIWPSTSSIVDQAVSFTP